MRGYLRCLCPHGEQLWLQVLVQISALWLYPPRMEKVSREFYQRNKVCFTNSTTKIAHALFPISKKWLIHFNKDHDLYPRNISNCATFSMLGCQCLREQRCMCNLGYPYYKTETSHFVGLENLMSTYFWSFTTTDSRRRRLVLF